MAGASGALRGWQCDCALCGAAAGGSGRGGGLSRGGPACHRGALPGDEAAGLHFRCVDQYGRTIDLIVTEIRRYPRVTVAEVDPPYAAHLVRKGVVPGAPRSSSFSHRCGRRGTCPRKGRHHRDRQRTVGMVRPERAPNAANRRHASVSSPSTILRFTSLAEAGSGDGANAHRSLETSRYAVRTSRS